MFTTTTEIIDNNIDHTHNQHLKWNYRQWAWEYLRRGENFRNDCLYLASISNKKDRKIAKKNIADKYFLKLFKSYDEPFEIGRKPNFLAVDKVSATPVDGEILDWCVSLQPHQVALVFNLRPSLFVKGALDAQIASATKVLQREFSKRMAAQVPKNRLGALNPTIDDLYLNLQILDAKLAGMEYKEIARRFLPKKFQNLPLEDLAERVRKRYETAKNLTNFGYLGLLASPHLRRKAPLQKS